MGLQGQYIRARDDPYFDGLLRRNKAAPKNLDFQKGSEELVPDVPEKSMGMDMPLALKEDSVDVVEQQAFGQLGRLPGISSRSSTSFDLPDFHSTFKCWDLDLGDDHDMVDIVNKESTSSRTSQNYQIVPHKATTTLEKSYRLSETKSQVLSNIPLPQSAATFYNGVSPQVEIVESSEISRRLNFYLKARRDDVSAGVPGRFLHAVIAPDVSDVASFASTIMYAFYLNIEKLASDQLCTVPVINMKRAELSSRAELKWLLDSCQIEESSLIFIYVIDLSYYDLFGSLQIVLVNGHKLPTKQE
ncbi:hypothetical protein Tsubulata_003615, partial [Turnera subulata]